MSNSSSAPHTPPPSPAGPLSHSCRAGRALRPHCGTTSSLSPHCGTTPHSIQCSPSSQPLVSRPAPTVPLTPSQALPGPHCPPASPQAYSAITAPWAPPQVLSVPPNSPWPHLRPRPALTVPSAPCRAAQQPIQRSPPRGPRPASASPPPAATLPGRQPRRCLPRASARSPDTHYSLSSTMSLRGSAAAACCPPGFPPASRRPLSPWPCPARLPVRLRLGLFRPRRSRRGRCAGSCAPASPPPAPLPTPPGALVPQRRAGAGRLCGNQRVTRSVRADLTRGRGLLPGRLPALKGPRCRRTP